MRRAEPILHRIGGRLLLLCGLLLLAGAAPAGAADAPAGLIPPDTVPPAYPVRRAEPLGPGSVDPRWGFQFAWGLHTPTIEAPEMDTTFKPGSLTKDGASIALDVVLGAFRLGYVRQIIRREPVDPVFLDGQAVGLLGFESDQLWAFHGVRPWMPLYLGYGLGWQRRRISVQDESRASLVSSTETLWMGALMADWAFAPPFSFQVRHVREQAGHFFRLTGETYLLAYIVPF